MSEKRQSQANGADGERLPIVFEYDNQPFRTIMKDDEPWFIAVDACAPLDLSTPSKAVARLDDDEKGVTTIHTPGGPQEVNIINESGLYNLIFMSRKPQAKAFKRWLTREVLPSIRKTGRYEMPHAEAAPPRPEPTGDGRFQITVPDYGRYTVTIKPGGGYHIHRNEYESLLGEANQLDCEILSHALKTIEAFWYKTQHLRSLGTDPATSGGFAVDNLESAILQGAKIAGQYLQVCARGLYKLADA